MNTVCWLVVISRRVEGARWCGEGRCVVSVMTAVDLALELGDERSDEKRNF